MNGDRRLDYHCALELAPAEPLMQSLLLALAHFFSTAFHRRLALQLDDIAPAVFFVMTVPDTACPTEIIVRPQRAPYVQ